MAVSGKTAAPWEVPYYLGTDKPPDMAAVSKAIAERVHAILAAENEQSLKWLQKGSAKQLVVCNASGVPQYVTGSGDVTNDESGVFTIGSEKVTEGKIKNGAVGTSKLATSAKPVSWYAPKIISTEETKTSESFTALTTADEIQNIVVPAGGFMLVGYKAIWKSGTKGVGRGAAAIFLGENQLRVPDPAGGEGKQAARSSTLTENQWGSLTSCPLGLVGSQTVTPGALAWPTTGAVVGMPQSAEAELGGGMLASGAYGGLCQVFAAAGTYNLSVRFKAGGGGAPLTVKERQLWVVVFGY
jgi:hypothetical protein